MRPVAVLEVGGTHASAAWVDPSTWSVVFTGRRRLDAGAGADELLASFAACLAGLGSLDGAVLSVAVPGPFDYAGGVGRFRDVGKFDALNGVDVGAGVIARLPTAPARVAFVNDAAAFGLGEWLVGAARGTTRAVAITLGTGVGSAFVDGGRVVSSGPTVPPDGHVYRLRIDGRPLEDVVSRRAILARYAATHPADDPAVDVAEVAARAAAGEDAARSAFGEPLRALGAGLAPWLARFGAEALVVGGGIAGSWPLVHEALTAGLAAGSAPVPVQRAEDPDRSTAAGAAWHAVGGIEAAGPDRPARTRDET
jgi:glucokinase